MAKPPVAKTAADWECGGRSTPQFTLAVACLGGFPFWAETKVSPNPRRRVHLTQEMDNQLVLVYISYTSFLLCFGVGIEIAI